MKRLIKWLFKTKINVKLVEVDFLELRHSPDKSDVEIIHWEKVFSNRFIYWFDRYIVNRSKYEEVINLETPVPVVITVKKIEL